MYPARSSADRERRCEPRYGCGAQHCPVSLPAENSSWEAAVQDLSRSGCGLLLDQEVTPGKFLRIQLFEQAGRRWHPKTMRVVHVRPRADGWWRVGCLFPQPLSDDEFWAMIGDTP